MPALTDVNMKDKSSRLKPKMKAKKKIDAKIETTLPEKRKRKIEDVDEPQKDDADEDSDDSSELSEETEAEELKQPAKSFGEAGRWEFEAAKFRKKLFSKEAGTELKLFASNLKDTGVVKTDYIKKYLKAGGSASEIMDALSEVRHADPGSAIAALKILSFIFLRTLRDFPEKQAESEEAALKLIQTAAPFLNSLLNPSQSVYRALVGLKLLTAMVSLSPRVAKEVLRVISLGKEEIRRLTSGQGNKPGTGKGSSHIRRGFLHFLLAFLIDKETNTIQILMAKENIIGASLLGLIHDKASMVNLILTTVRTNVVENPNVTKKLKQIAFNTRVLEGLVTLYEWQGPNKNTFRRFAKKKKTLAVESVTEEDLQIVQESLHAFFKVLLTSYRLGVVFPSPNAEMPKNHNLQAFSVIKKLQRPWDCPLKSDTLINVLKACPTLLRPLLSIYMEALTPRPTLTWQRTLEFVIKVLESVDMSAFTIQEDSKPNPKILANMICCLALPVSVMKAVLAPGLSHPHPAVKEATAKLLSCILTRLGVHLQKAQELLHFDQKFCDSVKGQIQHQLSNILPPVSLVWDAWNLITLSDSPTESAAKDGAETEKKKLNIPTVEAPKLTNVDLPSAETIGSQTLQPPAQTNQLATYVMLLLGYQEWLPHWLEISWGGGNAAKVLSSIKSAVDLLDDANDASDLKIKAVSLLTNLDHIAISPHETLFSWAIDILVNGSFRNLDARNTLSKILAQIGIMVENDDELNVWVQCTEDRSDCKSILSAALVLLAKNLLDYTEKQYDIISSGKQGVSKTHSDQLDEMLGDLMQDKDSKGKNFTSPYQDVAFSPLIVVLLQLTKEKAFKQNFEALQHMIPRATIQLLLQQSTPSYLIKIIESNIKQYPGAFARLVKDQTCLPDTLLGAKEAKFYAFLNGEKQKVPKELGDDYSKLKQLFRMIVYSVVMKVESHTFNEDALDVHWKAVEKLLKTLPPNSHSECLELIVCHPVLLNYFSMQAKSPTSIINSYFLIRVISLMKDHPSLAPIRLKALQGLNKCLNSDGTKLKKLSWFESEKLGQLLLNLNLDSDEVHGLIKTLIALPLSTWASDTDNSSKLLVSMISSLLQRLLILREANDQTQQIALDKAELTSCLSISRELLEKDSGELEPLQNSLFKYLSTYPHHLKSIPMDFVLNLLKKESIYCTKLALLCVSYADINLKQLEKWAKKVDLAKSLPVYSRLQSRGGMDLAEFETMIWPAVQEKLLKLAEDPSASCISLFKENEQALLKLVDSFGKQASFKKIAKSLQSSHAAEEVAANVICKLITMSGKHTATLVAWILRSITGAHENSKELLSVLCGHLLNILESDKDKDILSATSEDELADFVKASLKNGIGSESYILKSLAMVIERVKEKESFAMVLNMLLSHSLTMKCLLGHDDSKKVGILLVLDSLTTVDPSLMNSKLLPVLLGAYNASLSESDQIIFKLLAKFEKHGVSFKELQPLLWGEAAITRYSLRTHLGQSLRNQPSPAQVLHNLEPFRVTITLANFPIERCLEKEGTVRDGRVYDPAFLLPLFAHILLPEIPLQPWLFTRSALPITLMALSSEDSGIRNLAVLVISRLYFHYEAGRLAFEKKLWLHFMDTVRQTLNSSVDAQLAPVIALFLARSSQIISNPEHDMYQALNKFLLAKQSVDTTILPEFLRLMHSSEPGHRTQRQWLLHLLKDGIRNQKDFELFFSSFAFKILASYYNSPLADSRAMVDILQIFNSVMRIPGAAKRLGSSSGLISWINGAINALSPAPTNQNLECPLSENILILLQTMWKNSDLVEFRSCVLVSMAMLVNKIPALEKHLLPILELLNTTFGVDESDRAIFTEGSLRQLMDLCQKAGIRNFCSCKDLLQYQVTGDCEFQLTGLEKQLTEFVNKWIL